MPKSEFPRLNKRVYLLVLGISLTVFFVGFGPVWDRPFEIDQPVYWSYGAIPFLVLAAALLTRRLSTKGFFLDTLEITVWKFGVTYIFATAMWVIAGSPPPREAPPSAETPRVSRPTPPPTRFDPKTLGSIRGIAGSAEDPGIVFVSSGLEDAVFAPTKSELVLTNDGKRFTPPLAAVQVGQPLRLRSSDGTLHTVQGYTHTGRLAFNFPMLPTPEGTVRHIDEPLGVVELRCSVAEFRNGRLVVLHHPYITRPDSSGAFEISGIPNGEYGVTALSSDGTRVTVSVEVRSGETSSVSLVGEHG